MPDTIMGMWTHGNAFTPAENPNDLTDVDAVGWTQVVGKRNGWGAAFRGRAGASVWFHVPIPTPVLVPIYKPSTGHYDAPWGRRATIDRVFVMHSSENRVENGVNIANAFITAIDVWDGGDQKYPIMSTDATNANDAGPLAGDGQHYNVIQDGVNNWLVRVSNARPTLKWGVGISVRVTFEFESTMTFTAAGADFAFTVP